MQIVSKVNQEQIEKTEQEQIEYQIQKNNLKNKTPVITEQVQKVFCHSCTTKTELITKNFFYTFPDGKSVFFCNAQEKNLWVGIYKLHS